MSEQTLKQRIRNGEIVNSIGVPMDIEKEELTDILAKHECDYLTRLIHEV